MRLTLPTESFYFPCFFFFLPKFHQQMLTLELYTAAVFAYRPRKGLSAILRVFSKNSWALKFREWPSCHSLRVRTQRPTQQLTTETLFPAAWGLTSRSCSQPALCSSEVRCLHLTLPCWDLLYRRWALRAEIKTFWNKLYIFFTLVL